MHNRSLICISALTLLLSTLVACGGGGSSSTAVPLPPATAAPVN